MIHLDSQASNNVFGPRDLELLGAIAGQAALAIKNAMLARQVWTAVDDDWRHLERVVRDLPAGVIVLDRRGQCRIANHWVMSRAPLIGALERSNIIQRHACLETFHERPKSFRKTFAAHQ